MTGRTTVDVLSLEDFHQRLAGRLTEVESVLRKLNTDLQCRPPALGSFAHATENERRYSETHASYVAQAERLRKAIVAAQTATSTIMANYRTAEARNAASAADILAALAGVDEALKPAEGDPRV
jgi:regulator of protease activity HflC (stomatin/prohibitin superfamily)